MLQLVEYLWEGGLSLPNQPLVREECGGGEGGWCRGKIAGLKTLMVTIVAYGQGINHCCFGSIPGLLHWFLWYVQYQKPSELENEWSNGILLEILPLM